MRPEKQDACLPSFWKWRWLRYSPHAIEQAAERGITLMARLIPERIRLVDVDMSWSQQRATIWKFLGTTDTSGDGHFLVLKNTGEVVTVFHVEQDWMQICQRKDYRKQLMGRMSYPFLESILNSDEAARSHQSMMNFGQDMIAYRQQCFLKNTERRRFKRQQSKKHKTKDRPQSCLFEKE